MKTKEELELILNTIESNFSKIDIQLCVMDKINNNVFKFFWDYSFGHKFKDARKEANRLLNENDKLLYIIFME
jgi:hypothetical protein